MYSITVITLSVLLFKAEYVLTKNCTDIGVAIYQKVERLGFHRELNWLIDPLNINIESWEKSSCKLALMLEMQREMYIDPNQIAEFRRLGKLNALIKGHVNIEAPAHDASKHSVYIYLDNFRGNEKIVVKLPIHLRYQKSHFGGFGKAFLKKVNLLIRCAKSDYKFCNTQRKIQAPKSSTHLEVVSWTNISYTSDFEMVELLVPIGDLNHYSFVAVITCILGCAGCIYLLSIVTNT